MMGSFRKSMTWFHTWVGLLFCWLLYFIFVTGTLGYFDAEIDRWMKPEVPVAQSVPLQQSLALGIARLQQQAPDASVWRVSPAHGRDRPNLSISWQDASSQGRGHGRSGHSETLDSITGQPLDTDIRATGGGQSLYRMHYKLHYLPRAVSFRFVGIVTFFMLLALITGVIAHRKIFQDFFTLRMKRTRGWLDMHNLLSISSLPFHLMITYSGLVFMITSWMPLIAMGSYGFDMPKAMAAVQSIRGGEQVERAGEPRPLAELAPMVEVIQATWGEGQLRSFEIQAPGDANARVTATREGDTSVFGSALVFDGVTGELIDQMPQHASVPMAVAGTLIGLHEGGFAGPVLRWLYFIAGLIGSAMIATGAIYWIEKRKTNSRTPQTSKGFRFVDTMNIGTIVGLPIAIAAYFWANRLLPLGMESRAEWEIHIMFLTWAACLMHPLFRPSKLAWQEQCTLAALAFGLLPLLNALTTDAHLGHSLPAGDWALAGFDVTVMVAGALFALAARVLAHRAQRVRRQMKSPSLPQPQES